jgi:hypothetical protein
LTLTLTLTVTLLAESEDPAHRGLYFVLADRFVDVAPGFRAGAVDAALGSASKGQLDGARLGEVLADSLKKGDSAGLRRAVPCLRDLANGGAPRLAWAAVAELLTLVLPPAVPETLNSAGDLLAWATDNRRRARYP